MLLFRQDDVRFSSLQGGSKYSTLLTISQWTLISLRGIVVARAVRTFSHQRRTSFRKSHTVQTDHLGSRTEITSAHSARSHHPIPHFGSFFSCRTSPNHHTRESRGTAHALKTSRVEYTSPAIPYSSVTNGPPYLDSGLVTDPTLPLSPALIVTPGNGILGKEDSHCGGRQQ